MRSDSLFRTSLISVVLSILLSVLLFCSFACSPVEEPPRAEESAETGEPAGQIISFLPDFYDYWEEVKDKPLEERIELWDSLFEAKYEDFYAEVIYEGLTGDALAERKANQKQMYLSRVSDEEIEKLKKLEGGVKEMIPRAMGKLKELVPEHYIDVNHYITISLYTTSGAPRYFREELIVYYGLEVLLFLRGPEAVEANIAHEIFHAFHVNSLRPEFKRKHGDSANTFAVMGQNPVLTIFFEGLAINVQEELYPGAPRAGIFENLIPVYEEKFKASAQSFLNDLADFGEDKYARYFIDPSDDPVIPVKFGYWLGYKVVDSLNEEYTFGDMLGWTPDDAEQKVRDKIVELIGE